MHYPGDGHVKRNYVEKLPKAKFKVGDFVSYFGHQCIITKKWTEEPEAYVCIVMGTGTLVVSAELMEPLNCGVGVIVEKAGYRASRQKRIYDIWMDYCNGTITQYEYDNLVHQAGLDDLKAKYIL